VLAQKLRDGRVDAGDHRADALAPGLRGRAHGCALLFGLAPYRTEHSGQMPRRPRSVSAAREAGTRALAGLWQFTQTTTKTHIISTVCFISRLPSSS
jgi:hypothetical protein